MFSLGGGGQEAGEGLLPGWMGAKPQPFLNLSIESGLRAALQLRLPLWRFFIPPADSGVVCAVFQAEGALVSSGSRDTTPKVHFVC